jgi:hypothetical protein
MLLFIMYVSTSRKFPHVATTFRTSDMFEICNTDFYITLYLSLFYSHIKFTRLPVKLSYSYHCQIVVALVE